MLTRESILAAKDQDIREVSVPKWKGTVFVKSMTGSQRERYESFMGKETHKIRAMVTAWCACDATGNPLFSEADVEALNAQPVEPLHQVFMAALRVSAVLKEEIDANEKKSETTPGSSSSTDSPTSES
jgi:hypothetical protein